MDRREKIFQQFEMAYDPRLSTFVTLVWNTPVHTRGIANLLSSNVSCIVANHRLGKVKAEHRQMETGKWEDPLKYCS